MSIEARLAAGHAAARRARARRAAPTSAACRLASAFRSSSPPPRKPTPQIAVETAVRSAADRQRHRRARQDRSRAARAGVRRRARRGAWSRRNGAARAGARDGRRRSAHRVAGVAGAALARGEGEDAGVRGASRDARDAARRRSASARNWRPACFTRRSRRRAATPKWRASARPMVRACWCRPNAAAKAATSSSAGGWCCSTCRGSRRSSSNASDGSIASAAASRWRSSTFVPPPALAAMWCGCSRRWGCSASRSRGSSRNWRRSKARSKQIALDPDASLSDARFDALVGQAHAARTRIREAAYQQLHRDPYRPEMAPGILARVPKELDELNQEVVITASIGLGFTHCASARPSRLLDRARQRRDGRWLAGRARRVGLRRHVRSRGSGRERVHRLLRVRASAGRRHLCALRRERPRPRGAVRDQDGHGDRRRASSRSTRTAAPSRWWRSTWPATRGLTGPRRSCARPIVVRPVTGEAAKDQDWRSMVRRLGAQLDPTRRLHAVAAIEVRPAS